MTRTGATLARRVAVTEEIRAVETLAEPDYAAGWEVTLPPGDARTAEQWARATFEGAPPLLRTFVVAGWITGLGLRLAARSSPDHVLGWRIATNATDRIILAEPFRGGTAHNVVQIDGARVLFATFVRYETRWGRPLWSTVAPLHQRIIPYLLGRAASHAERSTI
jgi:hypothetical protein